MSVPSQTVKGQFNFTYDARKPQRFKVSHRHEITIQACDCGAADAGPGFQIHNLSCTFLRSVNEAADLLDHIQANPEPSDPDTGNEPPKAG